ncbi:MAG TPA: DUF3306 domain-containing protein [Casimicrobiaceae bacterium]|nr:DUF3306 domain-containing protein [Casimicrobiaceae bacterium]
MRKPVASERFSFARWSRRKLAETVDKSGSAADAAPGPAVAPAVAPTPGTSTELPLVDSLSFDSDFTAFLRPNVDPQLQRAALKQLFRAPRFNVMDGLDVYVDDYTKADPIPPDMLAKLLERFDVEPSAPAVPPAPNEPVAHEPAARAPETSGRASEAVATRIAASGEGDLPTGAASAPVPLVPAREAAVPGADEPHAETRRARDEAR